MEKLALDLKAFGWGFSAALVALLLLCEVAAFALPGWPLTHNWLALFSAADVGSLRNLVEGMAASVVLGWITAAVLVTIYNSIVRR